MLFRKAAFVLTIILVLGTFSVGTWFWKSKNRLHSNPTALRTNDLWFLAHAPATNLPPLPTNLFASIIVEQSTNQVELWIPVPASAYDSANLDYKPLEVHHAGPAHAVNLSTGSVRLAYIATAYAAPATNIGWGFEIPPRYFTPGLRSVTVEETAGVVPNKTKVQFDGEFPGARFFFVCSNLAGFKPLKFSVFDARTRHPLTQGYMSAFLSNVFWFGPAVRLWHQTPIEIVATIATGPTEIYSMAPTVATEMKYPGGVLRVLAASALDFNSSSTSSDGQTNHMTYQSVESGPPSRDESPRTSFILYSWPSSSLRGELEFVGRDGQKFQSQGGSSSDGIIVSEIKARAEEVSEIRLKYYPQAHRLIFTLPELPGLPEENRNLENLFDVHIPFMQFRSEHAFQRNISQLLQLHSSSLPLTFSNAYFPTFRTNTTPRALFLELGSLLSDPKKRLILDPSKNILETRPHPLAALIEKVKKKTGLPL